MGMVDITKKEIIRRRAEAIGTISLSPNTIRLIRSGAIKKGDPLIVAEISAITASKQAHLLIPHCHQIPLDMVRVDFEVADNSIQAKCIIKAQARTGVEMEALVAISIALNTIWDMVKYLEKDLHGQYPRTKITDIMVIKKEKYIPKQP